MPPFRTPVIVWARAKCGWISCSRFAVRSVSDSRLACSASNVPQGTLRTPKRLQPEKYAQSTGTGSDREFFSRILTPHFATSSRLLRIGDQILDRNGNGFRIMFRDQYPIEVVLDHFRNAGQ